MTEKELFTRLAAKDNQAFRYLYDAEYNKIMLLITRNRGKQEEAMDIFQEGLMILWINIKKGKYVYSEHAKVSTYLYGICRNLWMNALRKKKDILVDDLSFAEDNVQLDEHEYFNERVLLLEKCINLLGEKCRMLLRLFYYEKQSLREIAMKMNFTEKTVKNNKYRCMQKLRELYQRNESIA